MSTDHRKPFLAFVVLALLTAALVGVQRADAQSGRFLATVISTTVRVQGTLPTSEVSVDAARHRLVSLGPAFVGLTGTPALVKPLVDSFAGFGAGHANTAAAPGRGHAPTPRDGAPRNRGRAGENGENRSGGGAEAKAPGRLREAAERSSSEARSAGTSAEALEKAASQPRKRVSAAAKAARKGLGRVHARSGRGSR